MEAGQSKLTFDLLFVTCLLVCFIWKKSALVGGKMSLTSFEMQRIWDAWPNIRKQRRFVLQHARCL